MTELIFGALTLALLIYCAACMAAGRKYAGSLERVSEADFPMKRFLSIGLMTQRTLMRAGHSKRLLFGDQEVRRKLSQLYGEDQLKFFSMIYSADALTYVVLLMLIGCLLVAATGAVEMLVLDAVLIAAIALVLLPRRVDDNIADRQQAIRMEFPDFLSKYILLLGAGMTVVEAWETAGRSENMNTPFYREVARANHEMRDLGKAPAEALRGFAMRMRESDISRFVSSVVQYIDYGGGDLAETLAQQSGEAWKSRKQEAMRLGETAGTKLTGTMVLMFVAIVILVMAPALMTMQISF